MVTSATYKLKIMSPQLLVADIDRAINFYTSVLGFELNFRHEDFYAGIIKDGHSIHFKLSDDPGIKREGKAKEDLDILFSVDEIEELYNQLLASDAEIRQSLRSMPYGKEFYLADPDGNLIGFLGTA